MGVLLARRKDYKKNTSVNNRTLHAAGEIKTFHTLKRSSTVEVFATKEGDGQKGNIGLNFLPTHADFRPVAAYGMTDGPVRSPFVR